MSKNNFLQFWIAIMKTNIQIKNKMKKIKKEEKEKKKERKIKNKEKNDKEE